MPKTVTIFGGTGYLGRAVAVRLLEVDLSVRIAVRRPERATFSASRERLQMVRADVRDAASVAAALAGVQAAVNAVGLYVENRRDTFEAIHVRGARNVAEQAARAGVENLVHVSGIGADAASGSKYVRARAEGEHAATGAFGKTAVVRPGVLFGPGDGFLNTLDAITRWSPVFPLFGNGGTRLQPVYVGDVAEGIARILGHEAPGRLFEFGGPEVFRYREIVQMVLRCRGRRRVLLPVAFPVWTALARVLCRLPGPPLTQDQVILMRDDNVAGNGPGTLADLGVLTHGLEDTLPACLAP